MLSLPMGIIASTAQTPGGISSLSDISDMVIWGRGYDVNDGAEPSDDDPVSAWQDLSGNGYHLAQATGTKQPTYKTNIKNSKASVYFDGSSDCMTVDYGEGSQPYTYVFVVTPESGSDDIFYSSNPSLHTAAETSGDLNMYAGVSISTGFSYPLSASIIFLVYDTSGTGSYARINGANGTQYISIGTNGRGTDFALGSNRYLTGDFFKGYMHEFACWNKLLSPAEIVAAETILSTDWDIALS